MEPITDKIWQSSEVAKRYLEGIRGAVPFAAQQIEVMMRLIHSRETIHKVLDLGCGNGILGAGILEKYPYIQLTLCDFSSPMLDAARKSLGESANIHYIQADYSTSDWTQKVCRNTPFDVVVSGFSIHHQPDARKKEVYQEIYDSLSPAGMFINMEHVQPASDLCAEQFLNHLVDNLNEMEKTKDAPRTRTQIKEGMINNEDSQANILAPVDRQCDWLTEIGFEEVDCFFRAWELAVFGGVKPANS
jgi:ubiquinone/menaquinone biosynthesis C-methylase UbiE